MSVPAQDRYTRSRQLVIAQAAADFSFSRTLASIEICAFPDTEVAPTSRASDPARPDEVLHAFVLRRPYLNEETDDLAPLSIDLLPVAAVPGR